MANKINLGIGLPGEFDPNDPDETHGVVTQITEYIRRWNGEGADYRDRVVTVGELDEPLRKAGIQLGGDGGFIDDGSAVGAPKSVTVEALTGLSVQGAFEEVLLDWSGVDQATYAFTEIWRAETDNLSIATLRGRAVPGVFADAARQDKTYYYWVRGVSTSGLEGPYNSTAGTVAQTSVDPDSLREALTSDNWVASTTYRRSRVVAPRDSNGDPYKNANGVPLSYQATTAGQTGTTEPTWPTTLGNTVTDNDVTWQAVDAGKAPLITGTRNGDPVVLMPAVVIEDASIESAKIKDLAVSTGKIANAAIVEGKIGDLAVTNAKIGNVIQSANYDPGLAGWKLDKQGNLEANDATFRGHIEAASGTFSGTLTADAVDAVSTSNIVAKAVTQAETEENILAVSSRECSVWHTVASLVWTADRVADMVMWYDATGTKGATPTNDQLEMRILFNGSEIERKAGAEVASEYDISIHRFRKRQTVDGTNTLEVQIAITDVVSGNFRDMGGEAILVAMALKR